MATLKISEESGNSTSNKQIHEFNNLIVVLKVKGAGHNDIEQFKSYFERLINFMSHDLAKWHEEKSGEKKKLRTKDFQDEFDEIQSNDDLNISLTISGKSSSVSQIEKLDKDEPVVAAPAAAT